MDIEKKKLIETALDYVRCGIGANYSRESFSDRMDEIYVPFKSLLDEVFAENAPLLAEREQLLAQEPIAWMNNQGETTINEIQVEYWKIGGYTITPLYAQAVPAQQVDPLRYTSDGALAECPCCGSLDVGGAHHNVHCYGCGLNVSKPTPLQNACDAWNKRIVRQSTAVAVKKDE